MIDMQLEIRKLGSYWVFDDSNFNLINEPFVSGVTEILDMAIVDRSIEGYDTYRIYFSKHEGKNKVYVAEKIKEEEKGAWYGVQFSDIMLAGWLCPCIHLYFPNLLPEKIYFDVVPIP